MVIKLKKVDFKKGDSSDIERVLRSVVGKPVIIEDVIQGLSLGQVHHFYGKRRLSWNPISMLLMLGPKKDYEFWSNEDWIFELEYKNLKELYLVNREDESRGSL